MHTEEHMKRSLGFIVPGYTVQQIRQAVGASHFDQVTHNTSILSYYKTLKHSIKRNSMRKYSKRDKLESMQSISRRCPRLKKHFTLSLILIDTSEAITKLCNSIMLMQDITPRVQEGSKRWWRGQTSRISALLRAKIGSIIIWMSHP